VSGPDRGRDVRPTRAFYEDLYRHFRGIGPAAAIEFRLPADLAVRFVTAGAADAPGAAGELMHLREHVRCAGEFLSLMFWAVELFVRTTGTPLPGRSQPE